MKHGTAGGYRFYRCTCKPCRDANAEDIRQRRKRRRDARTLVDGRWVAPVPADWHGQLRVYAEYGCRCQPCTEANRISWAEAQQRRRDRENA